MNAETKVMASLRGVAGIVRSDVADMLSRKYLVKRRAARRWRRRTHPAILIVIAFTESKFRAS